MISVADLLTNNQVPSNYFATDVYIRSELELGLLENRRGDRLLAMPETLIKAIYSGLDKETGQASRLVLYNCGRWWGKNFYARLSEELTDYYKTPIADMAIGDFLQYMKQCWVVHGWGKIDWDRTAIHHGFLIIETRNSPFAAHVMKSDRPACFLDAGVFSAFFTQLSGRELYCIQTTCESIGADSNRFILGLEARLKPAEAMVESKLSHEEIVQKLMEG